MGFDVCLVFGHSHKRAWAVISDRRLSFIQKWAGSCWATSLTFLPHYWCHWLAANNIFTTILLYFTHPFNTLKCLWMGNHNKDWLGPMPYNKRSLAKDLLVPWVCQMLFPLSGDALDLLFLFHGLEKDGHEVEEELWRRGEWKSRELEILCSMLSLSSSPPLPFVAQFFCKALCGKRRSSGSKPRN